MAHKEARSVPDEVAVPCPVVLVSARPVVASDDAGRFEAVEPTIADGVGNVAPAGNANSAGPELRNVIEPALARALALAAEAGRWGARRSNREGA